jgi:hypothetical protein
MQFVAQGRSPRVLQSTEGKNHALPKCMYYFLHEKVYNISCPSRKFPRLWLALDIQGEKPKIFGPFVKITCIQFCIRTEMPCTIPDTESWPQLTFN